MTKPTKPIPLPYKNAPLGVHDLILQQVNFEDRLTPHYQYQAPEEVLHKEIPDTTWNKAAEYSFGRGIFKKAMSLMMP